MIDKVFLEIHQNSLTKVLKLVCWLEDWLFAHIALCKCKCKCKCKWQQKVGSLSLLTVVPDSDMLPSLSVDGTQLYDYCLSLLGIGG